MMWWNGWGWGWLGLVFMLAVWGGLIALIVWAVVSFARPSRRDLPGDDSAVEILRRRFARGEIDQAEFEERMRLLAHPFDPGDRDATGGRGLDEP